MKKDRGEIFGDLLVWIISAILLVPMIVGYVLAFAATVYYAIGAMPDKVTQFFINYIF